MPCFKCREQPDLFTGSLRQRECSSSQLAQAKGKAAEELKGVLWGSAGPPWEPPHCPPEGRKALELGFNAAQSGFQYEQSQPREKGSRKHTEPRTNTLMLYTHAHFSLLLFFFFFLLLSWQEQREQSQEKQISSTIPFRKFHFKPNQMMAAALGDV